MKRLLLFLFGCMLIGCSGSGIQVTGTILGVDGQPLAL